MTTKNSGQRNSPIGLSTSGLQIQPFVQGVDDSGACCGPPAGPPSSPDEQPGYRIRNFVKRFMLTPSGRVPVVKSSHSLSDWAGTIRARLGISRNNYIIAPGLYSIGNSGSNSPVLVTANYKLTFDILRKMLGETDAWLLVLDTRGINVWCAAGKGTFGTDEIVRRVKAVNLDRIVTHRQLILPQLGATGVSVQQVKNGCGFEVIWEPVRSTAPRMPSRCPLVSAPPVTLSRPG